MQNWQEKAAILVDEYVAPQGVHGKRILDAIKKIPRHLFIPEDLWSYSYDDEPLPIGEKQTISQPFIVAKMTELLALEPGDKVLEIGTGSGYQSALLAEMGMSVTTIERIEALALKVRILFEQLNYPICSIIADGRNGYEPNAPYRGIIVTAAAPVIEPCWLEQLDVGGRIVVPLEAGEGLACQRLLVRQKTSTNLEGYIDSWDDYCRFVPLLSGTAAGTKEALPCPHSSISRT
ncbi:protein-L-isoaspartate(D-aspartate) O-methyltransferase [Dehalobacter sp. TBBPA1]|uniref:protein-L-isoaspartate(D-aspartate) O-methyltransferase n=1 Tax=Dehalobacter sp. TBBPA1 TaxID=3235037 RepID=UPI0034A2EA80